MTTIFENFKTALELGELPFCFWDGASLISNLKDSEPDFCSRIDPSAQYLVDTRDGLVIGKYDDEGGAASITARGEVTAERWRGTVEAL